MQVNTNNQSISITKEQAEVIVNNAEVEVSAEQKEGAEEQLFADNIRLAKADGKTIELPEVLAEDMKSLYHLEMQFNKIKEQLAIRNAEFEEDITNFMQLEKYNSIAGYYYNFRLLLEMRNRDIDKAKLRDEEPEIYNRYKREPKEVAKLTKTKIEKTDAKEEVKTDSMFEKKEVEEVKEVKQEQ